MSRSVAELPQSGQAAHPTDRSPQQIIAGARVSQARNHGRPPMWPAAASLAGGSLLLWASFPPWNLSPLAWVALVPLVMLVRLRDLPRHFVLAAWLGGLVFYLPALQWLRLGDPTMYLAWFALSIYLALLFPLFVGLCRLATRRWSVPLVVSAPVVWVGLEYLRAHLFTGFSWYYLGHTQYRWLELIQISDITGAYGVSLVMMAATAAIAAALPAEWFTRLRLSDPRPDATLASTFPAAPAPKVTPASYRAAVGVVVLLAATFSYGIVRRQQADFQPGPRVALIQGNFLASLRIPPEDYGRQHLTHMRLTALAVREQPDVIVWPEAMFRWPLTTSPAGMSNEELQRLAPRVPPEFWRDTSVRETLVAEAQKSGAALVYGIEWIDLQPDSGIRQSNSAVFVTPGAGLSGRYDKLHLVPFGEYMPLKQVFPWLQKLTPYPPDFGLHAGTAAAVFEHHKWRMMPLICFEDTVPHLVRRSLAAGSGSEAGQPVDLLVNLSNDGWFHGSSGLDQHLISAAFRAVECRTPMVRAVNTGISAVIDGDGAIREPEVFLDGDQQGRGFRDRQTGRWNRQLNAALVSTVPLDGRRSLYVRYGDWFAGSCLAMTLFVALSSLLPRRLFTPPRGHSATE